MSGACRRVSVPIRANLLNVASPNGRLGISSDFSATVSLVLASAQIRATLIKASTHRCQFPLMSRTYVATEGVSLLRRSGSIFPGGKFPSGALGTTAAVRIWRRRGIFALHALRHNATLTGRKFRCDGVCFGSPLGNFRAAGRQMSVFRKIN